MKSRQIKIIKMRTLFNFLKETDWGITSLVKKSKDLAWLVNVLNISVLLLFSQKMSSQSFCGYDYDYTGDTLKFVGQKYESRYSFKMKGKTRDLYKSFNERKLRLNRQISPDDSQAYIGDYVVTNAYISEDITFEKYYSHHGTVLELTSIDNGTIVYYFIDCRISPIEFPFEYNSNCPEYNYYKKRIIHQYDKFDDVTMCYINYKFHLYNLYIFKIIRDNITMYSLSLSRSGDIGDSNGLIFLFENGYMLGDRNVFIETKYQGGGEYVNDGKIIMTSEDFSKIVNLKLTDIRIGHKDYTLESYESEEIMSYINALFNEECNL